MTAGLKADLKSALRIHRRDETGRTTGVRELLQRIGEADQLPLTERRTHEGQAEWQAAALPDRNRDARSSGHGSETVSADGSAAVAERIVNLPRDTGAGSHDGGEFL